MQTVNKWCLISLALRIEYGGNVASFLATQEKFIALRAERCIKLYSTANTLLFATYVGLSSKNWSYFNQIRLSFTTSINKYAHVQLSYYRVNKFLTL